LLLGRTDGRTTTTDGRRLGTGSQRLGTERELKERIENYKTFGGNQLLSRTLAAPSTRSPSEMGPRVPRAGGHPNGPRFRDGTGRELKERIENYKTFRVAVHAVLSTQPSEATLRHEGAQPSDMKCPRVAFWTDGRTTTTDGRRLGTGCQRLGTERKLKERIENYKTFRGNQLLSRTLAAPNTPSPLEMGLKAPRAGATPTAPGLGIVRVEN
jgi:hypothetical protein